MECIISFKHSFLYHTKWFHVNYRNQCVYLNFFSCLKLNDENKIKPCANCYPNVKLQATDSNTHIVYSDWLLRIKHAQSYFLILKKCQSIYRWIVFTIGIRNNSHWNENIELAKEYIWMNIQNINDFNSFNFVDWNLSHLCWTQ